MGKLPTEIENSVSLRVFKKHLKSTKCTHRNCRGLDCASQNRDIVSALILKSFSARSVAEQRLNYEHNRPLPKHGLQCGGRKFRFEWYERKLGFVAVKFAKLLYMGWVFCN